MKEWASLLGDGTTQPPYSFLVLFCLHDVHKLHGLVALCALEALVQLCLNKVPDGVVHVFALPQREALLCVLNANVFDFPVGSGSKHTKKRRVRNRRAE